MLIRTILLLFIVRASFCDKRSNRVRRIVGGAPADVPPEDDPVLFTRFAGKNAKVTGIRQFPHYVFRGIRYAEPPLGPYRFVRPRERFLQGEINATLVPPPCLQPVPGRNTLVGSEDCLFLNIFTPNLPTGTEGLPVVIWVHGGGFRYGSASQYGVQHLVGKQLVVVTIQYRLGSLGFLSSGTKEFPGNVALWDMALATQWVRNYIGFFGGNPNRIVVMGHGTGASSTLLITLSNIAKGISGVVAMSGTAVSQWATDNAPQNTALEVANQNGCPTTSILIMVKCLQNLPPETIIKADSKIEFTRLAQRGFVSGLNGQLTAAPVAEGYYDGRSLPPMVQDEPINDLYNQKTPQIPLLTGITKHETKRAIHGHYKEEIIKKLQSIPNFLDKVLIQNLHGFIARRRNNTDRKAGIFQHLGGDILNFRKYIEIKRNNIKEGLHKVSEATSDALFNVPAFLTAGLWSQKGAPTYLYSFEHLGKRRKGSCFLKGIPLIGNTTEDVTTEQNDTIGHGDDLAYLFDPHDIHGNPLEETEELTEDDIKVREMFTQMIADFARHGKVLVNNREVPSFTSSNNHFIQIKPKPEVSSNFKFCEMALWCNIAERLQSKTCQFLNALDTTIKGIEKSLFDTINVTHQKLGIDKAHENIDRALGGLNIMQRNQNPKQNLENVEVSTRKNIIKAIEGGIEHKMENVVNIFKHKNTIGNTSENPSGRSIFGIFGAKKHNSNSMGGLL